MPNLYICFALPGANLFFLTQYGPLAASSRTRVFQYLPLLEAAGFHTRVVESIPDSVLADARRSGVLGRIRYYLRALLGTWLAGIRCVRAAPAAQVVFVQKVLLPLPLVWLLKRHRRKIVYDFDDAIFTTEAPEEGWLAYLRARRHRRALPAMLRSASCAVVENDYTGAYAAEFCPRVVTITGPIDTEHYRPAESPERAEVVLGWIGSPSTASYLDLVRRPLVELGRRNLPFELVLIGTEGFDADGVRVTSAAWSSETEVGLLQRIDIGLMPLPDDPWTRGKGGYKILQYMATGLPVVASPVGINRILVEDGVNGYLADTADAWVSRLTELIQNRDLRRRMGAEGRRRMEKNYSLQASGRRLVALLSSLGSAA